MNDTYYTHTHTAGILKNNYSKAPKRETAKNQGTIFTNEQKKRINQEEILENSLIVVTVNNHVPQEISRDKFFLPMIK